MAGEAERSRSRSRSPPNPLAPEAEDARGQTSGTGVPHNEMNRNRRDVGPREATWANNIPLTHAERIKLIREYQHERHGDPRGLTASGLGTFIKEKGIKLRKGYLQSHFMAFTHFKMSADGVKIIPPEDQ